MQLEWALDTSTVTVIRKNTFHSTKTYNLKNEAIFCFFFVLFCFGIIILLRFVINVCFHYQIEHNTSKYCIRSDKNTCWFQGPFAAIRIPENMIVLCIYFQLICIHIQKVEINTVNEQNNSLSRNVIQCVGLQRTVCEPVQFLTIPNLSHKTWTFHSYHVCKCAATKFMVSVTLMSRAEIKWSFD